MLKTTLRNRLEKLELVQAAAIKPEMTPEEFYKSDRRYCRVLFSGGTYPATFEEYRSKHAEHCPSLLRFIDNDSFKKFWESVNCKILPKP
jgi:hypothetical protein